MDTGVSKIKGLKIHITGIVQGVGFRPFIYRLAQRRKLKGNVQNNSQGVLIEAWGTEASLEAFIEDIYKELPGAAIIDNLAKEELKGEMPEDFQIIKSRDTGEKSVFISPDLALCEDCRQELLNKDDRRYGYPFINCTNCGPRYSIIKDIPYDRPFTTMAKFPMCDTCLKEYEDPLERRFHAQPNACGICGPHYTLEDMATGALLQEPLKQARDLILAGKIVAVKGIGGFHLACNAYDEEAVKKLRQRKRRESKPLAVMVRSLKLAKELAQIDEVGEELLFSPAAPILLLPKGVDYSLAEGVAPCNPNIGLMMAYAPVHYVLLQDDDVFVMTSANLSHEPMLYDNEEACQGLKGIADYILYYNRDIANPVDDSVVALSSEELSVIRRGRGYAPVPIKLPVVNGASVLALGGELKSTFALDKGGNAFLSPHLGDLENQKTYELYKSTLALYKELFSLEPQVLACDLHPEYFSSKYAKTLGLPIIAIQHHHAHIASVLAEHNITTKVLGIALDGTGYGADGKLWGGEFLLADLKAYRRVGHFPEQLLPGGEKAIKEPWRLALYQAYLIWGDDYGKYLPALVKPCNDLLLQATKKGLNAPITTSAGRVFDTVSALLGICHRVSYEGQAAIELELAAQAQQGEVLPVELVLTGPYPSLDFTNLYRKLPGLKADKGLGYAAYTAHLTIAQGIVQMIEYLSTIYQVKDLAFSGGVCQNRTLMDILKGRLKDYRIYTNKVIPANDGGLSYGQLAIAKAMVGEE